MGGQHTIPILVLQEFRKRDIVEKIRNFIGCQAGFSDHDLLQEIQKFIGVAIQYETDSQQHIFIKKMEMQGQELERKNPFPVQKKR